MKPHDGNRLPVFVAFLWAFLGLCAWGPGGAAGDRGLTPAHRPLAERLDGAYDLPDTTTWIIEGDQNGSRFGYCAGSAGDVNGDGFSDIVAGAPLYDTVKGNAGRVFVYYGSAGGPPETPSWTMEGDQTAAELGISVACAGDVNDDGYDDVIVGAGYYDGPEIDTGRVYVFYGGGQGLPPTPSWVMEGDIVKAHLGFSVDGAGDVNNDGYDDVIIGSFNYRNPDTKEGRAYVYHGGPAGLSTTPAWTAESNQAYAYFAISVAGAGDANNDGYDDVIVGASHYDVGSLENAGRAYVFLGSGAGLSPAPSWIVEGSQAEEHLGRSVAGAGDVNNDGCDDVIVGAPDFDGLDQDEGIALVYLGGAAGLSIVPARTKQGGQQAAHMGCSVSGIGDINDDAYSDAAAGAYGYDNGAADEGKAFIYRGSADGLSPAHSWSAEGDQTAANFGFCVAPAGDVDDDGRLEVLVGSPGYTNAADGEGRVFVYRMDPDTTGPTVTVLDPNGGETWYIGNSYDVTWDAVDASGVDSVEIYYSANGGLDYAPVAHGLANDSHYSWTIPNTPSSDATVKIVAYDPGHLTGEDVSDRLFSIVPDTTGPIVTVLDPNGGETWYIGSDYEIAWTAEDETGVDSVSVFYSVDGGENYLLIASGEPNDSSYVWTIPDSPAQEASVKVVAYDSRQNESEDASDGFFTIAADTVPPEVTVTSPNGGESWPVGAPQTISWIATDDNGVDSVSIYYSRDGGEIYGLVASGEPNDSSYAWLVPAALSDNAVVKVLAFDRRANAAEDESDGPFAIVPDTAGPVVEVGSPNGGETWGVGSLSAITWTAADPAGVDSVSIYYSIDGGGTYDLVSSGEANDSLYLWEVPDTPSDSVLIVVIAYDPSLNGGEDASDSLFVISTGLVETPGERPDPGREVRFWGGSPNPFVGQTEIAFYLPEAAAVRLEVYDAAGRLVARLADDRMMEAGLHKAPWNGKRDDGTSLSSGVYFCLLRTQDLIRSGKMILAR